MLLHAYLAAADVFGEATLKYVNRGLAGFTGPDCNLARLECELSRDATLTAHQRFLDHRLEHGC